MVTFDIDMEWHYLSKAKAKEIRKLVSKKERDSQSLFIVEGEKCVLDMLSKFSPDCIICSNKWLNNNLVKVSRFKDKIYLGETRDFEIISSLNSLPEIIAVLKKPREDSVIPQLSNEKLYVVLDEIQDPGNLGTIIRTCDWFGIYDLYASKNTVDAYSPKVVQAAMGSLSRVDVHYLNLKELIINNRHIQVIGTLLSGQPLDTIGKIASGMLLLGNEGRGISTSLRDLINLPLTIPPSNPINHPDSLNVAIAAAIILSHIK